MKKTIILMAIISAQSAFASTITIKPGTYAEVNHIIVRSVTTKAECKALDPDYGAKWDAEKGFCFVRSDNTVMIEKTKDAFKIQIMKVGGNLHTCDFEETAILSNDGTTLTSKVKVKDYETNLESDCIVEVHAQNTFLSRAISVTATANCQQNYCGSGVVLPIEHAKKIK